MQYTLKTRKVVETRELNSYMQFLMTEFVTGAIDATEANNGKIPASIGLQMSTLTTLFSVKSVDGEDVKVPTNRKELIQAFSNFSGDELNDLAQQMAEDQEKNAVKGQVSGESNSGS
ncbi:hypothetical protein POF51_22480 [Brevibacillus sp. AG]|uniref:hypothetical protein n=1 Tax=Brevibacillus sp. AG TaxID=3020891 RepID=UPI00232E8BD8|nr:hypothetical protein [Brevibacillus sp. AG]MDC0763496.1 hypothetical protein [Brevibacillus sp. AG]